VFLREPLRASGWAKKTVDAAYRGRYMSAICPAMWLSGR
jgi:hypothetical protein